MKNQTFEKNCANSVNRVQQLLMDVLCLDQYGNSAALVKSGAAAHLAVALENLIVFDLKANSSTYLTSKRSVTAVRSRVLKARSTAGQVKLTTPLLEADDVQNFGLPAKKEATPAEAKGKKAAAKKPAAKKPAAKKAAPKKAAPKKSAKKAA